MNQVAQVMIKLINGVMSLIQIIIGIGIILKLFGAKEVPFVRAVYAVEAPLLRPFNGIFAPIALAPNYMLDMSAIFALIIYSLVGYILIKLVAILSTR